MAGNYPPGVTGNEPQITGEWPCSNCGQTLPEDGWWITVDEDGGRTWRADDEKHAREQHEEVVGSDFPILSVRRFDGDTCPDGCPEPDYDAMRERDEDADARGDI